MTVIERANARALRSRRSCPTRPTSSSSTSRSSRCARCCPAVLACAAPRFDALAMVKPQFEVGRERVGKGGVVRDPALRGAALGGGRRRARRAGRRRARLRPSGLPGPEGNRETFVWLAEGGARAPCRRRGGARGRSTRERVAVHDPPALARHARRAARAGGAARRRARRCASTRRRPRKHGLEAARRGSRSAAARRRDVDLCVVLGGDGTILTALRAYAGTSVPVFAVNYGEVGFLATLDPDGLGRRTSIARSPASSSARAADHRGRRAPTATLDRDQRHLRPPQAGDARRRPRLRAGGGGDRPRALRRARRRHAAGSTGYNLANGGPVLAWGVAASSSPSSRRTR